MQITHLSCEDLLSGTVSPVHCISWSSLKLSRTLQRDSCSLLISIMAQQGHHLSAKQEPQLHQMRIICNTVEASISRHPQEAEKVSATGIGRLRECVDVNIIFTKF